MGCSASNIDQTRTLCKKTVSLENEKNGKNLLRPKEDCSVAEDSGNLNKLSGEGKNLTIIHFNDVYSIEPHEEEPVGGAARFVTKVKEFSDEKPLILFSGDCLNPSLMSTVTKGRQMIPVLNKIGVHGALFGNHDFDFGVDDLIDFKNQTKFPWLLSNVIDDISGDLLAEGLEKLLIEWQGKKIGIIGLIEEEWLVTLATVDARDVTYYDFIETGTRLAAELRKQGADLIIALTHMRIPNDRKLLCSNADIDLILGGHDHHYEVVQENGKTLVKSGTDFRSFSKISVSFDKNSNRISAETKKIVIDSSIEVDKEIDKVTKDFFGLIEDKMKLDLGVISTSLDGRFSIVRTQESNLGNFIADIMRMAMQTDVAILNSGTLRSDRMHSAGNFTLKDLVSILPMMDTLVVLAVSGECLVKALENGVSEYPKHEGRFPQVSGVTFSFNPDLPPGQRILRSSVKANGQCIDWKHEYSVCVKAYLANGRDGYDVLKSCRKLVDEENGQTLPTIVQNHFESMKIVSGLRKSCSKHKQSVLMNEDVGISDIIEKDRCRMTPKVEGRIQILKLENGNQEQNGVKPRPASPKPRGRTSRIISVSAPNRSLMGLTENSEDDSNETALKENQ